MGWRERSSWYAYGLLLAAIILLPNCNSSSSSSYSLGIDNAAQTAPLSRLPLTFEANVGQTDAQFSFLARGSGFHLLLNGRGALMDLHGPGGSPVSVKVSLEGANPAAEPQGLEQLPGIVNYFIGSDPKHWHTNIHTYSRVQFRDVYPGVNLVYYGNESQLENDFVLAPHVNPNVIRLRFEGMDHLRLDPNGDLLVATHNGTLRWKKPVLHQPGDGAGSKVQGNYAIKNGQVSFEVGPYDPKRALVIDPILTYSTYYGRQGDEAGKQIAVDAAGNVYVAGWSTSMFPTTPDSLQPQVGGNASTNIVAYGDAVVLKLNPAGTAVIYATYLGGNNDDAAMGIAVDTNGNAYLTGATQSPDFPTTSGAFQTTYGGASATGQHSFGDAYIAKLNAAGNQLLYSTYLGGNESDEGWGIAIDSTGNAYVTGITASKNFPVTNGVLQASYRGGDTSYPIPAGDAFVAKLNPAGTALVYSTFLGGTGDDRGHAIAVDAGGNAYVAGATNSPNFPTTPGAPQARYGGNGGEPAAVMGVTMGDAFVAKLNPTATALVYSTYLGGLSDDAAAAIAVDSLGNAYVTGLTLSVNFPVTAGAFQTQYGRTGGSQAVYTGDAFVTKLNAAGTAFVYSTYLGGNLDDVGTSIAVDAAGNAYVAGGTSSLNFPTSADALQPKFAGGGGQNYTALGDAFVTKLDPAGRTVLYSTYLGGENDELAFGMAIDNAGNIFLAGNTASAKFPVTPGAVQARYGGARGGVHYPQGDIFISRIGLPLAIPVGITVAPATASLTASQTQQFIATVTNTSNVAVTWSIQPAGAGSISSSGLYAAPSFIAATQAVTVTATSVADTTQSAVATVTLNPTPPVFAAANVVNDASLLAGPVTPGMVVRITGTSFGASNPVQGSADASGLLGTSVGDTRVLFDGKAGPIVSVSSGSLVAIVPYAVAGNAKTQVQLEYKGVASAAVSVPVTDASPGLFAADSSGAGQGLIYNADASPNSDANPAPIGTNVTLIGTGEGQTSPPGTDGLTPGDTPPGPNLPVAVKIGDADATVVSAGGAPGMPAGYFQVTVTIPDGVVPGDLPVVVMVGNASSQPGITVAVAPAGSQ